MCLFPSNQENLWVCLCTRKDDVDKVNKNVEEAHECIVPIPFAYPPSVAEDTWEGRWAGIELSLCYACYHIWTHKPQHPKTVPNLWFKIKYLCISQISVKCPKGDGRGVSLPEPCSTFCGNRTFLPHILSWVILAVHVCWNMGWPWVYRDVHDDRAPEAQILYLTFFSPSALDHDACSSLDCACVEGPVQCLVQEAAFFPKRIWDFFLKVGSWPWILVHTPSLSKKKWYWWRFPLWIVRSSSVDSPT